MAREVIGVTAASTHKSPDRHAHMLNGVENHHERKNK